NMMETLKAGTFYPTLFTNTALNVDTNEPWWEGMDGPVPENILDWQGRKWDKTGGNTAAHPNSRFTVSISQCPTLSPEFDNPQGVPISAIIFGSRRSRLLPLVYESFSWSHGVFCGARMGSETTAAAIHQTGKLRRDPMAMIPFCGYNMGDYFAHWLNMGRKLSNPPKIFGVNWFRLDEDGRFLWPGFGENMRVLKWIIDRINNNVKAKESPIGLLPYIEDLELSGLNISRENMEKLFKIDNDEWKLELEDVRSFFNQFGEKLPKEIWDEFKKLESQL
ncbi:MAG TPA: phosphoenolpyruvate carboxykinase (GTP), partial [bacterium]|nr:phosphoenolpyruvate carboxykinase (GTP) [bacterium]